MVNKEFHEECGIVWSPNLNTLSMYTQYYGSGVPQNDQVQDNNIERGEQVYRPDGNRVQTLQNPFPVMNMNMGIQGQQYDPRFLNLFNPAINPNARIPYTMVSNTCGDGMRAIANPYDRNLYAYGVPIQYLSMNSAGYPNMGVYPPYMGIKQGVPIAPADRSQMLPPNGDFSHQQIEKQMQAFAWSLQSHCAHGFLFQKSAHLRDYRYFWPGQGESPRRGERRPPGGYMPVPKINWTLFGSSSQTR